MTSVRMNRKGERNETVKTLSKIKEWKEKEKGQDNV